MQWRWVVQIAANSEVVCTMPEHVRNIVAIRWYCAETLPARQGLAMQNLHRQHFASFIPRFRNLHRHARWQYTVLAPLLPGYVFVRYDPDRGPGHSINGTFGIKRQISAIHAGPQPRPEEAMPQIFARSDYGIVTRLLNLPEPGQAVRNIAGPFADSFASIDKLDGKRPARVLLDLLGGPCPIDMNLECLAPTKYPSVSGH